MGERIHSIAETYLTLMKGFLIAASVLVACTVASPALIAVAGFTTAGVAAGSLAAGVQSTIGNVAAGSAFATLQSVGAAPLVGAKIGAAAGAVAAL